MPSLLGGDAFSQETLDDIFQARTTATTAAGQAAQAKNDTEQLKGETQQIKDDAVEEVGTLKQQTEAIRQQTETLKNETGELRTEARDWASKMNAPVKDGEFSAKHHAAVSEHFSQVAQQSAASQQERFLAACTALGLMAPAFAFANNLPSGGGPGSSGMTNHGDGTFTLAPGGHFALPFQLQGQTSYQVSAIVAVVSGGGSVRLAIEQPFGTPIYEGQAMPYGRPTLVVLTQAWQESSTQTIQLVVRNTDSLATVRCALKTANGLIALTPPLPE